jgi:hypothetical protein
MIGYRPYRTKEIVKDHDAHDAPNGSEPFRATIVTSLSFEEIDAIVLDGSQTFSQLFRSIAPFVVAWNAFARNSETGEFEPLSPPAEAGPDILRAIEPSVSIWLALQIRTAPLGDPADPKESSESTPSGPMPDGQNEPDKDSPALETPPANRADSI